MLRSRHLSETWQQAWRRGDAAEEIEGVPLHKTDLKSRYAAQSVWCMLGPMRSWEKWRLHGNSLFASDVQRHSLLERWRCGGFSDQAPGASWHVSGNFKQSSDDLAPGPQGREPQTHRPPRPRKQCWCTWFLYFWSSISQTKFQTKLKSWSSQSALLTGCGVRRSHGGQCNALCAQQGKKVPGNGLRIFSQQKIKDMEQSVSSAMLLSRV